MKNLKNCILLFLLFLALLTVQSCEKDELPVQQQQKTDSKDGKDAGKTPNTDNDNSGNNSTPDGSGGDSGSITLYKVDGDNLIKTKDFKVTGNELKLQKDLQKHQEVWALVKKIVPLSYRNRMNEFMIYAGEKNGSAGYVFDTSKDLSTWQMGIAIDFAYEGGFNADGELSHTIIHEFGHILTLGHTQVNSSISKNNCNNFFTGEGCANENAYINKTYQLGWADIWSEFQKLADTREASQDFYQKYKSRFVSGYAATNPGEDIAEVFATFVIRNGGVNGNAIAEQKIKVMYDHSELVTLRNYVRGNKASAKSRRFLPASNTWKRNSMTKNRTSGCVRKRK